MSEFKGPYDKNGKLHKLGYVNKSWRERVFAINVARGFVNYFKTDADFQQNNEKGSATQAGTIMLKGSILYLADYMDKKFCIELAARDAGKQVTTRHYFIYAESGAILREWMSLLVEGGAIAAGPAFPMRVVPDTYKSSGEIASADGSALPRSYSSLGEDPALIAPLPFPVVLAKFGFLQKRGVYNTSFKTRFCRIENVASGNPVLVYYDTVEATKNNGTIPLQSISIDEDKDAPDELSFKLTATNSSRTFHLRAPSKAQKRRWISILMRVGNGEKMATDEPKHASAASISIGGDIAGAAPSNNSPALSPQLIVAASTLPPPEELEKAGVSRDVALAAAIPTIPVATKQPAQVESPNGAGANTDGTPAGNNDVAATPAPVRRGPPQVESPNGAEGEKPKFRSRKVKRASVMSNGNEEEGGEEGVPASNPSASPAPSANAGAAMSPPSFAESVAISASPESVSSRPTQHAESSPAPSAAAVGAALASAAPAVAAASSSSSSAAPSFASSAAALRATMEEDSAHELENAYARAGMGCTMYKVPTSSFASIEKKRFYLLDVNKSAKAQQLLLEAQKEIKSKDSKKLPYYTNIQSSGGYLLHWDSTKAFTYESFVWLSPKKDSTRDWQLHWGQDAGLFAKNKKKLKEEHTKLAGQSLTIQTSKRSFDLIIENPQEFKVWKLTLDDLEQGK